MLLSQTFKMANIKYKEPSLNRHNREDPTGTPISHAKNEEMKNEEKPKVEEDGEEEEEEEKEDDEDEEGVNAMAEDLDQIGLINLSYFLDKINFNLPNFDLKNISNEINKQVDKYKSYYRGYNNGSMAEDGDHDTSSGIDGGVDLVNGVRGDAAHILNSLKTILNTRLQIKQFSSDLTAALDKLQPITEVIHRAVTLPADDLSDFEDNDIDSDIDSDIVFDEDKGQKGKSKDVELGSEAEMDPEVQKVADAIGLSDVISSGQEYIAKFIKQVTGSTTSLDANNNDYKDNTPQHLDMDNQTNHVPLDQVEGLSSELIKELTEVECMNDFKKEEILRSKILAIQQLSIDQTAKNRLMTKLMMGNYCKYINQQLKVEKRRLSNLLEDQRDVFVGERNGRAIGSTNDGTVIYDEADQKGYNNVISNEEMNGSNYRHNDNDENEDADEVIITEEDQQVSYNDAINNILGCHHYQRSCKLECATCHKWYTCPFCHDAQTRDHKMVRNQVRHILCMHCKTPQNIESKFCVNCEKELANYFCSKCVLYDDDPNKDIYHCDKCGICRLGLGLDKDYFHCDVCNICLSIDLKDKHKCVTNTTHCNCTICNEYLFTSVQKVVFMKCGHSIHQHCYDELIKHSYKCPICKKSIANVDNQFRLLDQEISQSPMPEPYNEWMCTITCNDCKGKSNCQYHVLGLKCKYCKSYNTNQVKIKKPNEPEEEPTANEVHDFDANIMRLVLTNLQSNFGIDLQHGVSLE